MNSKRRRDGRRHGLDVVSHQDGERYAKYLLRSGYSVSHFLVGMLGVIDAANKTADEDIAWATQELNKAVRYEQQN